MLTNTTQAATTNCSFKTKRVKFKSHSQTLVGDLRIPFKSCQNGAGVVTVGPQTTIKEMVSGKYAAYLAKKGFTTLAFDPRTYGDSGGKPREYENPDWRVEDILSAIQFMKSLKPITPQPIGLLGICCGEAMSSKPLPSTNQ